MRAAFLVVLSLLVPSVAGAAPPYAARGLTLPRHDWALNFGIGMAHDSPPSRAAVGLLAEVGWSPATDFELGLRLGARPGPAQNRDTQPDIAARLYDTESYGGGSDPLSNPELRFKWRFVNARVAEIGLDARFVLPVESRTNFGLVPGIPMTFHFSPWVRLDTGVYVPVVFDSPARMVLSIPARLWFHPDPRVYMGPIAAFRLKTPGVPPGAGGTDFDLLLGLGVGWQVASTVDLKLQAIFPRITDTEGARNILVGFGAEVRIE